MKVVLQRVKESSVIIDNKVYNSINNGLMVLVGFTEGDTSIDIDYIVKKICNLRIFEDENGVMNKSVIDVGGEIAAAYSKVLYSNEEKADVLHSCKYCIDGELAATNNIKIKLKIISPCTFVKH